jgi:hypothetical protein
MATLSVSSRRRDGRPDDIFDGGVSGLPVWLKRSKQQGRLTSNP